MSKTTRDYNTISPSARSLLLMKGLTDIPYAREAAQLMMAPEPYIPDYSRTEPGFWARVVHFENRYHSIDQLLNGLPVKNILELSSGFSFRGLAVTRQQDVHYIDTDLPDLIVTKQRFTQALLENHAPLTGKLETLPLNALDEQQFSAVTSRFAPGPVAVVNEGLLMYLDNQEKTALCNMIRGVLEKRGGYWITADVYIKRDRALEAFLPANDQLHSFFEQHHIHDNMFDSFEAAAAFFEDAGFVIDQEAQIDYTRLTAFDHLLKNTSPEVLARMRQGGRTQTTWRLKLP
ncbi:class I SAM-dependent methyltransferase [Chitinophaga flava]|uniref:Class I SAM-dependent methyltransferase n=1 Tax=Chitinophaga flava TaxID=2259036 RepID=A0A365XXN9_9BACT|nr:class I SAM-dependent methyltransferase [Chitinophaga flava]RBL90345.1 hypothetical protein DF182_28185 [Chitinophaga flava]